MVHESNGQIHIYAGGADFAQRHAKAQKPHKPKIQAAPKTDYFPWWLAAAAILSIIFCILIR